MTTLRRIGGALLTTWETFSFVFRELAGFGLILVAYVLGSDCLKRIDREQPIQAALILPLVFFSFRGGIHLLKVSVAARLCLHARDRATPSES